MKILYVLLLLTSAAFAQTGVVFTAKQESALSHRDGGRVRASMMQDDFDCAKARTDRYFPLDHFTGHAQSAFHALGLD